MGRRARHYRVARLRVFKGEIVGLVKPGDENIRRFGIGRDARAVDGEKRALTTTARKPPLRTDTFLGFLGKLLRQSLRCGGQSAQNLVTANSFVPKRPHEQQRSGSTGQNGVVKTAKAQSLPQNAPLLTEVFGPMWLAREFPLVWIPPMPSTALPSRRPAMSRSFQTVPSQVRRGGRSGSNLRRSESSSIPSLGEPSARSRGPRCHPGLT